MVLGDPETLVAVGLSRAGGIDGVEHGLVLALVGAVRHQVKHRNFYVGRHNFSFLIDCGYPSSLRLLGLDG